MTEIKNDITIYPMARRKKKEFDFKEHEAKYGDMYHLVLDRPTDSDSSIRYVSDKDHPKYAGVNGDPLFFNWDKEFRIATEYVIMYPKVYVKASKPFKPDEILKRCYIQ